MSEIEDDEKPKKQSLLGHDLDALSTFLKRCAALGALLGYLHHMLTRC